MKNLRIIVFYAKLKTFWGTLLNITTRSRNIMIQQKILSQLIHNKKLRFSDLWDKNVESNKFSYHLKKLEENGLRVELDQRQESVSKKVRDAQVKHINYICVVGEREEKDKTVTVRTRNNEVTGAEKIDEFAKRLVKEIKEKK